MTFLLTTDRRILDYLKCRYLTYHRYPQPLLDWDTVHNLDCIELLGQIPDSSVDLVLTDEPYGTAPTRLNLKAKNDITTDFEWDRIKELPEVYKDLLFGSGPESPRLPMHLLNEWVFEAYRVLKPTGLLVNFGQGETITSFKDVCRFAGFTWRASIPWLKTNTAPHFRKANFRSGHETIFFASKGKTKGEWNFMEQQEMVNFIIDQICPNCNTSFPVIFSNNYDKPKWFENVDWQMEGFEISAMTNKKTDHPTEKPEWLISKLMQIMSNKGDIVVDPFIGKGTVASVAKKLGRRYIVNDLNTEYAEYVRGRLLSQANSLF
jgi:DNA modification methylase